MLILRSEAEQQNLIIASGNDVEEMATLELIPENEDQQLPKKKFKDSPAFQKFSKIIKNGS